jgi:drug/metabolite transporter (DMT)-like permease
LLLCALSLAVADALTKKLLAGVSCQRSWWWCASASPRALLLPLLVFHPPAAVPAAFWGWVGLALPLEVLAMVLYMLAIRDSPLALTLPYLAFTPVFADAHRATWCSASRSLPRVSRASCWWSAAHTR